MDSLVCIIDETLADVIVAMALDKAEDSLQVPLGGSRKMIAAVDTLVKTYEELDKRLGERVKDPPLNYIDTEKYLKSTKKPHERVEDIISALSATLHERDKTRAGGRQ